jgi:3-deoxy-D-manno-octulosonic acid kinase
MPSAPSSNLCSVVPMIQVMRLAGKADCNVRTTGSVWQQSPIADSRRMQIDSGADEKSRDITLTRQVLKLEDSVIVYDDAMVSQISQSIFEPDHWQGAAKTTGKSGGRGAVLYIRHAGQDWVLRHYYRGGLPGKLLRDQFFWTGASRTRSLREWDLLQLMVERGLPVPVPVAARYVRHGFVYTADLITRQLPGVMPFSDRLAIGPAPQTLWQQVGECIARFHSGGFFHADLNAHNLQVDEADNVYLLDWDRGEWRVPGDWRAANLARLQRSLRKINSTGAVQFEASDWDALVQAYARAFDRSPG